MKIKVADIPEEESLTLQESLRPEPLRLETPVWKFSGPLELTASFQRTDDVVLVAVELSGPTQRVCARCLEPYSADYSGRFHLDYQLNPSMTLDITEDVRQEILLSYPVRPLCRDDCRGLCPQCGANLNERSCSHASS